MIIRREQPSDFPAVSRLTRSAFESSELGYHGEAELVDKLRAGCPEALAWIAEDDDEVVGHILFTPATVGDGERPAVGMGLAPMSVIPGRQKAGIGSRLVKTGLDYLRSVDSPFVVVLGHPEYYPKFGFRPAVDFGVRCDFPGVPEEIFFILPLAADPATLQGTARYHPLFYG